MSPSIADRSYWLILSIILFTVPTSLCIHHLQLPAVHLANRANSDLPLVVTNNCPEVIYPAILTQGGTAPSSSGFRLATGESNSQTVSADWRGRVWGRTNCTFDGSVPLSGQGGRACGSGDCGNFVQCQGAGNPPATLAEFTYGSNANTAFYDISLVDGYNLPIGIIFLPGNIPSLQDIPPNFVNAMCIGSSPFLDPVGESPDVDFGTNSSYPIPLEQSMSINAISKWCPWPLQLNPPQKPGDGVYPYPDDNIVRPLFNPCYSACAKYQQDQYCCSGSYADPSKCKPSFYSIQAKNVCPDAYSFAFDDQSSTFTVPQGGGFEVVFCPSGRSSNTLKTFGQQLRQIVQTGSTSAFRQLAQNKTYIAEKSGVETEGPQLALVLVMVFLVVFLE